MENKLLYQLALTQIKGLGNINGKNLIAYVGDISEIFTQNKQLLQKIPGVGHTLCNNIIEEKQRVLDKAKRELEFIEKHQIQAIFFTDKDYPIQLKEYYDAPLMLYYKGNVGLNFKKSIAVIGTRNATEYGKRMCAQIIKDLAENQPDLCIVSGLAYGIDICAHKDAIQNHLPTIGVLGHGLDRLYPAFHKNIAKTMLQNGGLLTEYMSETNADKPNFVKRNRIVAGITNATLVIESAIKGGAMITVEYANSYNKDVFAIPGRSNDEWSQGCNKLIKINKASLVEKAEDIEYMMGWTKEQQKSKKEQQHTLFVDLTEDENKIYLLIKENKVVHIDIIAQKIGKTIKELSPILLALEFKNCIKCLPGNAYSLL